MCTHPLFAQHVEQLCGTSTQLLGIRLLTFALLPFELQHHQTQQRLQQLLEWGQRENHDHRHHHHYHGRFPTHQHNGERVASPVKTLEHNFTLPLPQFIQNQSPICLSGQLSSSMACTSIFQKKNKISLEIMFK